MISDFEFQLGPKHFVKNLLRLKKSKYYWWFLYSDRLKRGGGAFYNSNDNHMKRVMLKSELYLFTKQPKAS